MSLLIKRSDMSKGLSALTNVFDKITDPTASETICDAISLFSNALHDTNVFRRSAFKPDFKKEYAGLCAESKPIKDTLFKEVSEEAKTIAEKSKITNKITKRCFTHTKGNLFEDKGVSQQGKQETFKGDLTTTIPGTLQTSTRTSKKLKHTRIQKKAKRRGGARGNSKSQFRPANWWKNKILPFRMEENY